MAVSKAGEIRHQRENLEVLDSLTRLSTIESARECERNAVLWVPQREVAAKTDAAAAPAEDEAGSSGQKNQGKLLRHLLVSLRLHDLFAVPGPSNQLIDSQCMRELNTFPASSPLSCRPSASEAQLFSVQAR